VNTWIKTPVQLLSSILNECIFSFFVDVLIPFTRETFSTITTQRCWLTFCSETKIGFREEVNWPNWGDTIGCQTGHHYTSLRWNIHVLLFSLKLELSFKITTWVMAFFSAFGLRVLLDFQSFQTWMFWYAPNYVLFKFGQNSLQGRQMCDIHPEGNRWSQTIVPERIHLLLIYYCLLLRHFVLYRTLVTVQTKFKASPSHCRQHLHFYE
jgi:hypothetical protein